MIRSLLLLACLATGGACASASTPPGAGPSSSRAAEQPVIEVAEALFRAMEARDTAALRRMFLPDAPLVVVVLRTGSEPAVQTRGVSQFVASIGRGGEPLRERMWDPRVEIEGDFASLWAPYDFHQGDRFSHCGTDAFHLVRYGAEWRIAALTYTVRTEGCTAPTRVP